MYKKFFIEMDDLLLLPIGNKTFCSNIQDGNQTCNGK